ncbi:uncharacterized protein LOC131430822 [Malaya genurostris]|uniref:uncharacterized protein LOC131430822 n=1 Tax=Malaya genurostris TaxID=325434 RepID=UPI0026F3EF55|nr:uncharacterized protein LOC131430822 [Malaya genurostris]
MISFWHILLFIFAALFLKTNSQAPCPFCKCECENRSPLNVKQHSCVMIRSMKNLGWLYADRNNVFTPNKHRYVYMSKSQTVGNRDAQWNVKVEPYYKKSYPLNNAGLGEWLIPGSDQLARNAERRYVFTHQQQKSVIPKEGYFQFIKDPNNTLLGYRIRNAWSGEYLYVDEEYHQGGNFRVYLYRQHGNYDMTDKKYWFDLIPCP